jgi:hypothetical protein
MAGTTMGDPGFWARLVLGVLATWRVAHLLANEDGPAALMARLRLWLATSPAGRWLDCFGCVSMWVAVPFAFYATGVTEDTVVSWLAVAGGAFLLERLGPVPLVVERLADAQGVETDHGMLQSDTRGDPHDAAVAPGADGSAG